MRVGIDLSPLAYGNRTRGIGTYAENLVAALAASDTANDYVLLTMQRQGPAAAPLPENFSVLDLRAPPLGRAAPLISHQLFLPWQARAHRLDVLHALAVPFNPSMPGVAYWQSVPTVVTLFDVLPLRLRGALLSARRYRRFYEFQLSACRRAARVITASNAAAQDLAQYRIAPRENIAVIPLAPPPPAPPGPVSEQICSLLQSPFLLHVGGAEPQKNQQVVLRAFGQLCRNPAFRHSLVLVGQHHLDDQPALDVSVRAARRIVRVAHATRTEMDTLYAHADALVFPSLYEGFGLPVLEAMRAGTPVITSNVSSLPEVAGQAALCVDPNNADAVAQAVRRVLTDEHVRVSLSSAGERRAAEFTWAKTAEMTRQVYEQAAASR